MSARRKTKSASLTDTGTLIYCGPDIHGAVRQFSVLRNGVPDLLNKHIENCPVIKQLLVTPDKLQDTRVKINVQGTAEHVFYRKVLEYRKELKR